MLGFSLQKLLFTAAAIALVWYGFKWLGRMRVQKQALAREQARRMAKEGRSGSGATKAAPDVEDMIECTVCGSFVASSGTRNCGKTDCPYPG